ncbi:MAG: protein-glutamate methylesterase/protein-glutamine glutaminase [Planctomycetota bacterium]
MRVLVVDDSAFMRRAISRMLDNADGIEVVGLAKNGREAIEMAKKLRPEVITLDVEMPEMDGLTALRRIMSECPTPVVMCSSLTTAGSRAALQALKLGAVDVVAKDSSQISLKIMDLENDLVAKVRIAAKSRIRVKGRMTRPGGGAPGGSRGAGGVVESKPAPTRLPSFHPSRVGLVVIGSSTGGPPVVESILSALPGDFCAPVVVAQHMPRLFTESLASRLDERCRVTVVHAESGMRLENSHVYILPGGLHGRVMRGVGGRLVFDISEKPTDAIYKPSVNELMASAGKAVGKRALGVMLTGMGEDGLKGAHELVRLGGTLLAQNEETCVVYGMPKAVTQAGLVEASLAPGQLAQVLRPLRGGGCAPTRAAG